MPERTPVLGLTVDAWGARDFDDAIWAERLPDGSITVTVSISDVACLVPKESGDDVGAASRGMNLYDGNRAAIFGDHIGARLASLAPRVSRPVVVHRFVLSPEGREVSGEVFRGTLKSLAALNYTNFDDILATPDARLHPMSVAATEAARMLWTRRVSRVGMPEWDSAFDRRGRVRENVAFGMIGQTVVTEFMAAANYLATRIVNAAGAPMIFRNQGPRPGGPGGRYEVVSHGNMALGLPHYGQFSSPIRRYPDLVNQRIQCAVIDGDEPPYSLAENSRICAEANRAAQRADAATKARTSHDRAPVTEGDTQSGIPLGGMDVVAFRQHLRRKGGLDWRAAKELVRRLDGGLVTHVDIAWLLFGKDSPADDRMRLALLCRVATAPGEIDRIWRIGRDDHSLPTFEALGARQDKEWVTVARVGRFTSEASGTDPVRVRDTALIRLAASALLLPEPQMPSPDASPLRFADTRARGRLEELCGLMGWDAPEFTVEEIPVDSRHRGYRGSVGVLTDTFHYRSPLSFASNRPSVEMSVAEFAIAALQPYADDALRTESRLYGIDMGALVHDEDRQGPVAAMENFCRRYAARHRWIWAQECPSLNRFQCRLEVTGGGNTARSNGRSNTRRGAMADAASRMVGLLTGRTLDAETVHDLTEDEALTAPSMAM
jgi:ribonuclease R